MSTDDIIEEVGGMGRFQILALFVLLGPRLLSGWSMLMMSFGGVVPDNWWCATDKDRNQLFTNSTEPDATKICPSAGNSSCSFVYSDEKYTVVNEWDLICDKSSIGPLIIAIQMGGVLVGCILAGQSSDLIGRKKTYIMSIILHGGFNLVAAFSTSWEMFAALRFCIGSMIGAILTTSFPYYMEFVGQEWRPITAVVPFWQTGTALLALTAWLLPDWSHVHIILAAIHVPFLAGFFFIPESLRWLAVHGHLKEAEDVVDKMARINRREKPTNTSAVLKAVYEEEQRIIRESGHKYTYLDIYRTWRNLWRTLVIQFVWMCLSFVFYGISFGVGKLHGNLYLNIFLVGVVGIPGVTVVYFLNNRIGRRWSIFIFFGIASLSAFSVSIVSRFMTPEQGRGQATTALALMCRLGVSAAWSGYAVLTTEHYPTPIRNLGYGAANSAARAGSIVSPYIFTLGSGGLLLPFVIVGSLMAVCGLSSLLMTETRGCPLQDTSIVTTDQGKQGAIGLDVELTPK